MGAPKRRCSRIVHEVIASGPARGSLAGWAHIHTTHGACASTDRSRNWPRTYQAALRKDLLSLAELPDVQRLIVAHEKVAAGPLRAPRSSVRRPSCGREPEPLGERRVFSTFLPGHREMI
jgi:hypothetical protein